MPEAIFDLQKESFFDVYGIGREQIRLIGLAELFGGLTVWFWAKHWIAQVGLSVLIAVTAGAIFFHAVYDEVFQARPAIIMFVLSSLMLFF